MSSDYILEAVFLLLRHKYSFGNISGISVPDDEINLPVHRDNLDCGVFFCLGSNEGAKEKKRRLISNCMKNNHSLWEKEALFSSGFRSREVLPHEIDYIK